MKKLMGVALLVFSLLSGKTQPAHSSYPSLLWEISGNGLKKPSYLFGSMHVSNKMVFHLSDSFYTAIAACALSGMLLPFTLMGLGRTFPIIAADGAFYDWVRWIALPAICALDGFVLMRLLFGRKNATVTNVWLGVAVLALLLDAVLTLACPAASLAWYLGKLFGLVSAGVVLAGYIRPHKMMGPIDYPHSDGFYPGRRKSSADG